MISSNGASPPPNTPDANNCRLLTPDQTDWQFYKLLCDPVAAIPALFDFHLWPKQAEIVDSIQHHERTAVHACHSSGKTAIGARILLWWLSRYPGASKVITTAPTDNQVRRLLWGEVHAGIRRARETGTIAFPDPNLTELRLSENWWAYGFSTSATKQDEGVRFQGFHGGHLLVIFDEAVGIHPDIWTALEGVMSSGHVRFLALMNPTVPSGPAYDICHDPAYNVIHISAFDTPNFEGLTLDELTSWRRDDPRLDIAPWPDLLSRRWVYDRFHSWGPEHPHFQSRVMGKFPTQSKFALFPLALLQSAIRQGDPMDNETRVLGIDVAGSGDADTVAVLRDGGRITGVWGFSEPDPRGAVLKLLDTLTPLAMVNVDATGIGYNFALHLADTHGLLNQGGTVQLVNVGDASIDPGRYANLKAELYWSLHEIIREGLVTFDPVSTGEVSHAPDVVGATRETGAESGRRAVDLLIGQLAGLQYETTPKGLIAMESKRAMKARGVASPDYAEACMLAFTPNLPATEGKGMVEYQSRDWRISAY